MKGEIADCANCGKLFEQRRKDHLFCSSQCRWEYWSKIHPRITIGKGFKIVPDEQRTHKGDFRGCSDRGLGLPFTRE